MFKFKFVLPMLAFVLAIGMSFAFTDAEVDEAVVGWYGPQYDRVQINVNCTGSLTDCTVQFIHEDGSLDGGIELIYPNETSLTPLRSSSSEPIKMPRPQE